jgi:uncharacterized protein YjiS (DUF1127 family)
MWTYRSRACFRAFATCWDAIARFLAHRAAIAQLRELEDHELRDISLMRNRI